jgi:hypothetical protein
VQLAVSINPLQSICCCGCIAPVLDGDGGGGGGANAVNAPNIPLEAGIALIGSGRGIVGAGVVVGVIAVVGAGGGVFFPFFSDGRIKKLGFVIFLGEEI